MYFQFGIAFKPSQNINEILRLSKLAKKLGFKYIVVDDEPPKHDVWTCSTAIALNTKLSVGPGVTNPKTRHPAITAIASASLHQLNPKTFLGIASGTPVLGINQMGIDYEKPIQHTKEAIEIIREIWSGRTVNFNGEFFKIKKLKLPKDLVPESIEPWVGGRGKKALQLAAEYGDIVFPVCIPSKNYLRFIKKNIKTEKTVAAWTAISFTEQEARKKAAHFYYTTPENLVREVIGFKKEKLEYIKKCMKNWDYDKASLCLSEKEVRDMVVFGNKDEMIGQIARMNSFGMEKIIFGGEITEKIVKKAFEILKHFNL